MSHLGRLRLKVADRRYSQIKKALSPASSSNHPQTTSTEAALRQSEAFYHQMFERNRAIKLVIDASTAQIIEANQAACDFYGYTLEQIKALHINDIDVQSEAEIKTIMQRTIAENGMTFQTQHRLASGAVRDVEVFAGLLEVNAKRYLYGIIQDITAFKQTEKALRQSEALYRLVTQHMPGASVVMFDADMRYTLADGQLVKRTGYDSESLVGKTPRELFVEAECAFIEPLYKRALQGESFMYELIREEYAYETYIAPVVDDSGRIIGGITLNHDITERKIAEKALHKSEALHQLFMKHMPKMGVFMFDSDMRYTLAEGPFLKRFGPDSENVIGKTPQETLLPQSSKDFIVAIYQRALQGESFNFERVTETTAYEAYVTPLRDNSGNIVGGMTLNVDITERRFAENALHKSEALHQLFMQHMPNTGVIMFDNDRRFTLTEGDFLKRTGLILEEMIGKTPEEVFSEETLHFMQPLYERVLRGESFAYDRTTSGYAYQAYATPFHDAAGQILGGMFLSHDVTEAKRAETALRASEMRFHSLVDLAPVGIIQTDPFGKRVFCNTRWCEMTGVTLEQALSDEAYKTIYPDDLEIAAATWDNMMETHLPFDNHIFRYQRPDETIVWVSGNGRPLYDAQGEITGYIGSVTDISEHKQLEEALLTSELRFRTLIDFAPVGIVETDAAGNLILGNTHWHILSAIPEDYTLIDNASGTIHLDDLARVQSVHKTSVETASPIDDLEYRFVHPDGKVVWVSDSSRPLLDPQGVITGHIVTMTDITERKRLEEELRQNEERLRVITDNIQDLITQNDTKGNLTFVSQSSRSILGYEPESLLNTSSIELIHPEDRKSITRPFQTAIETGAEYLTVEARLRHADGHYIWAESIIKFVRDVESNITGAVYISRDISERKRMQDLLLEKEKLQTALDKELELNNLKTRMMNRIAHEFRTPLTVIQATSETLTHYLDRLTPDQRDAKAVTIKGQIQRLTNMLDEIGKVIKTDFTPDRVHRISTDLSRLCRDIATHLEQELNQPGKFVLDLPETTEVLVDPQVLKGAFTNIMHNAARFSDSSAAVNVSLSCVEKSITLCVTDTGIGIAPNEQPRIFEPFFRGSNIGESSGLGVGLTMTRAAIEAHGGTIAIQSVLGKGTTVTVWIPV